MKSGDNTGRSCDGPGRMVATKAAAHDPSLGISAVGGAPLEFQAPENALGYSSMLNDDKRGKWQCEE